MSAAQKTRKKPGLVFLIAGFSTLLLLLSTVLTIVAYRVVVEPYYMNSLQNELLRIEEELIAADFDSDYIRSLQTDVRMLVVDERVGEISYADPLFRKGGRLGNFLPPQDVLPPQEPQGPENARPEQELASALVLAVNRVLDGEDGSFFSADNWERRVNGLPLNSKALVLSGLHSGRYYSLWLEVASVNEAMSLAGRFAVIISLSCWALGLVLILFYYARLTKTSRAIVRTAGKLAKLDFSSRCPPAITREFDALSSSTNTLSDQLQSHILQLRQTNEALSRELDVAARQRRMSIDLLNNLSHDLKTPIAIISGYAEGLTEGVARTEAQQQRYAEIILQESAHMQDIVSKLLALGRLEADESLPEFSSFDLTELVQEVLESFQLEIEKEGIRPETSLAVPLPVFSDYESIRQVVINYVQNSIYHMNGGTRLRIVTEQKGSRAVFRIANSSAPISGDEATRIWDKLHRGSYARSRDHGEAGLGLSIVKGNMERLGEPYGFRNLTEAGESLVEFYIELPKDL